MAIINTFQKCLESPYLFEDKEAPARVGKLLAMAGDRLEAAVNIQTTGQGDPADASLLAYEAMFACLRALVYHKGYREAGLRCLMLACENLYVKTGQLEPAHIIAFERAQGLKTPPAENVNAAAAFVKRTLELLGQ
ncbi:MAG TPA: hypothetical protein VGZ22_19550 [Isosphaeraceae bacterium]|jgi:uncharacterized protein (UPF0332 family)|nr:hypothetical protein [Isosphaeraceae bacterium]